MNQIAERWLETSVSGYFVSNLGNVLSPYNKVLKPRKKSNGYTRVYLGKDVERYIHHLVAEAFIGPRQKGYEIDHIDRDRQNNRLENLRYLTLSENRARRKMARGSAHGNAILTEKSVKKLREMSADGMGSSKLASIFKVSPRHVRDIIQMRSWKHV